MDEEFLTKAEVRGKRGKKNKKQYHHWYDDEKGSPKGKKNALDADIEDIDEDHPYGTFVSQLDLHKYLK